MIIECHFCSTIMWT